MALLIIGSVPLIVGIWMYVRNTNLIKNGIKTKGIITDYEEQYSGETYSYYPIVSFTTDSGESIATRLYSIGERQKSYKIGTEVEVFYNPDKPNKIVQNNVLITKVLPICISLMGAFFFVIYALNQMGIIKD